MDGVHIYISKASQKHNLWKEIQNQAGKQYKTLLKRLQISSVLTQYHKHLLVSTCIGYSADLKKKSNPDATSKTTASGSRSHQKHSSKTLCYSTSERSASWVKSRGLSDKRHLRILKVLSWTHVWSRRGLLEEICGRGFCLLEWLVIWKSTKFYKVVPRIPRQQAEEAL